ncbi:UV-resistance 8 protein, partial [Haematococcus lacustris]
MEEPYIVCIAAGASHSLALTDCGIVASWGKGEDGQLGHGSSAEVSSPQAVSSLLGKDICIVRCGAEYSLAVSKAHEVWSWGWGDFGRLGHGNTTDQFLPKPITFFSGMIIKEVTCGDTHTLVVTDMGELFTFGRNQNGQLGLGHTEDQLSPQRVEALQVRSMQNWPGHGHCVASVAGGAEHSIAATSQGKVFGWGWGRYGNLGTGQLEDKLVPTPAIALDAVHISKVNCGWRHSVAVSNHGVLYAFGWGKYGQLGHGDNTDQPTATPVAALQGKVVVEVVGGWRHTLATDSSGSLWGWGWNKFGQLGLGDTVDRNTPCLVASLDGSGISLLASGWRHSLAVTQAGAVYSWGRGVNGQLGLREEEDRYQPTLLPSLSRGQLRREQLLATAQLRCHSMELADRYA